MKFSQKHIPLLAFGDLTVYLYGVHCFLVLVEYPMHEGEMRMNRNSAIEIPVVSASMSWRKPRIQGERIPKQSRDFRDEPGVACLLSEGT